MSTSFTLTLVKALAEDAWPEFSTVMKIIAALGVQVTARPKR